MSTTLSYLRLQHPSRRRKAKHDNYRQVQRFNTDGTDTLRLDDAPQEVVIRRNEVEASRLTTTPKIKPEVMSSVQLYDTSSGVKVLDLDTPEDQRSPYDDFSVNWIT